MGVRGAGVGDRRHVVPLSEGSGDRDPAETVREERLSEDSEDQCPALVRRLSLMIR